ncbi:MAG: CRISPR-associated endonuclease Cas1 [Chloroflexi bacterium]|nr:CRISPR-associated endonuclease Cas1 [Chloroflexota bacterium]
MTILYVQEQGAVVRREGEEVRVTLDTKVLARLPVREAEQVVVCGNVQLTTQAAALLLQNEVDVVFLSYHGVFRGRLMKSGSKFARLRHAQLQLSGDEGRSVAVAKGIVRAKLSNQRNLLADLTPLPPSPAARDASSPARRGGSELVIPPQATATLAQAMDGIERMKRDCHLARDPDTLRGYEGKAGAFYFAAVGALLDRGWSFQGRKYYPAPDPFNAALSFGYALLQKDISATVQLVGLDPFLGCFHAMQYDRPSLVLDLMEEFRPLAVDRVILDLVLSGKLKPADFTFTGNPERPVELGSALIPRIIQAYEARVTSPVLHTPSGERNTIRRCFELQARIFARVVVGDRAGYEGVVG